MNWKKLFTISIIVGISMLLISGILYVAGGNELFKVEDSYTTENKTIEKEETIDDIKIIKVNTNVGNINFNYIDQDNLKLELINPILQSEQPIKIKKYKETLELDINDVDNRMKFHVSKGLKNMKASKLIISIPRKYKGDIDISSDVGNIKGEYEGKRLKLSTDVGNIDVEIDEIESGEINTDIGNIRVKIKEESNLTLNLETELGKIKNSLKNIRVLENSKDDDFKIEQKLKLDLNDGGSLINMKSDLGNIEVYN